MLAPPNTAKRGSREARWCSSGASAGGASGCAVASSACVTPAPSCTPLTTGPRAREHSAQVVCQLYVYQPPQASPRRGQDALRSALLGERHRAGQQIQGGSCSDAPKLRCQQNAACRVLETASRDGVDWIAYHTAVEPRPCRRPAVCASSDGLASSLKQQTMSRHGGVCRSSDASRRLLWYLFDDVLRSELDVH